VAFVIISRHALCHLERHLYAFNELNGANLTLFFLISLVNAYAADNVMPDAIWS